VQKVEQPFAIKKKSMQLTRHTPCVCAKKPYLASCDVTQSHLTGLREGSKPVVLTEEPRHGTFATPSHLAGANPILLCSVSRCSRRPLWSTLQYNFGHCVTKIFGGLYFPQDSGRPLCPGLGTVIPPATLSVRSAPLYQCNLDT